MEAKFQEASVWVKHMKNFKGTKKFGVMKAFRAGGEWNSNILKSEAGHEVNLKCQV